MSSGSRRAREIVRDLERRGWEAKLGSRSGHYKCYPPPGGPLISVSGTPRASAIGNIQAMIRSDQEGRARVLRGQLALTREPPFLTIPGVLC